jgi:hypothetical protein
MEHGDLPGAIRGPTTMPLSPAHFDEGFAATGRSELIWRLSAQAFGEDYPAELQAWGATTWWVLGRCVSALRVGPGQLLVDLAWAGAVPGYGLPVRPAPTSSALIGRR